MSIKITTTAPKRMQPIDVCRACAKLIRPYMKQKFMGPIYYGNFIEALGEKCVLFVLDNKNVIGFVQWKRYKRNGNLVLLNKIAIDINHLKEGLGTRLLNEFLEKHVPNKDVKLRVSKNNTVAISLYEKFGFKKTNEDEIAFQMTKFSPKFETFYQS